MKGKIIIITIATLLMITFLVAPWAYTEAPRKFLLEVKVMRNGKLVPAIIYVRLVYPDGMKFVKAVKTPNGIAWVWIDYIPWKSAWDEYRMSKKVFADPTIVLTVFTEDNYVGLFPIKLKWHELKPFALGGKKTVIVKPWIKRIRGKPIKITGVIKQSIISFEEILKIIQSFLQSNPAFDMVLVCSHEETNRVTIGKIYYDPNIGGDECASLFIGYYRSVKVGISLAFAFLSDVK